MPHRITALVSVLAAFRRGLVVLAALAFVLSGMASIHTVHAVSGGHDMLAANALPQADESSHCDSHNSQTPETKPDRQASCCASACAPLMVLTAPPVFAALPSHGDVLAPASEYAILDRRVAGLFRPPRIAA